MQRPVWPRDDPPTACLAQCHKQALDFSLHRDCLRFVLFFHFTSPFLRRELIRVHPSPPTLALFPFTPPTQRTGSLVLAYFLCQVRYNLLAGFHTPRHFPRNPLRLSTHLFHIYDYHPLILPSRHPTLHLLMSLLVRGSVYYLIVADGIGT